MRLDIYEGVKMAKRSESKINYASFAEQYNCDYRTVKRYFESNGKELKERKGRKVKKVLDGYESMIEDKYINDHAPAIAIYQILKTKYGYKGSYSTLKSYIHNLKEKRIKEAVIRFETSPGLQCQIDWKEELTLDNRNGEAITINIFLSILGYSRLKYIELTTDKTQKTLFRCLTNAFKYFNGVPNELLFDNMRTVVDQSRTQFNKPVYNQTLYYFSQDAGFIPKSCVAFRPKTKGKVETVARIMNRLKACNHEFDTIEELNKMVEELLHKINYDEVQATTGEIPIIRFAKEKEYLRPEPNYSILEDYYIDVPPTRIVPKDCLIMYQGNKYSVPPTYVGKSIKIRIINNELHIYYNENFVCKHTISVKKINYLPQHYKEIAKSSIKGLSKFDDICEYNLKLFDNL